MKNLALYLFYYSLQSSVNCSKKAIENHHGEVPVVVQTNIKQAQQKKYDFDYKKYPQHLILAVSEFPISIFNDAL